MDIILDPIDEELNAFERDIRQLKIEYEQYFGGGKKRPPTDIEWRMDLFVKRHGDRAAAMNYTQRFRYHNLTQTYAKYREMFHKRLKKREEGVVERHYGAAVRELQAQRAELKERVRVRSADFVPVTCTDPVGEPQKVEKLFTAFRRALERSGQSTSQLSREQFEQFLRQKTEQLHKQKSGQSVEYVVTVEAGKASLKARFRG